MFEREMLDLKTQIVTDVIIKVKSFKLKIKSSLNNYEYENCNPCFCIQDTMLTLTLSARLSMFAQLTDKVVWARTLSSAPTEPSSTRTTSSAIGGSTLTAQRLQVGYTYFLGPYFFKLHKKAQNSPLFISFKIF